jgi:hypothetical protein
MDHLTETLKHYAINRSPTDLRDYYLNDNSAYSGLVWRLRDIKSMDFAFIYTQNNSKHRLTERIELKLQGYEVIIPSTMNKFVIDIMPGSDEIIILKRTAQNTDYSMNYLTCPIARSDAELLIAAKDSGLVTRLGTSQAYVKMLKALDAAVLLVVNPTEQRLSIDFNLSLLNLTLVGHPEGAKTLKLSIEAGQQGAEILRPIKLGETTDIQITTKY